MTLYGKRIYTKNEILNRFRNSKKKTIRLKKDEECPEITENCPNAGPNPSLTGMRELHWGKNALILIKGYYAYYLGESEV